MAIVYAEDWVTKVQERLAEPTKWKDFMRVEITNTRVLHNPYRTDPTIQTLTRYTAYTLAAVGLTDESVTIDAAFIIAEVIDRGDLAQSGYLSQMEAADRQGTVLNEKIESYIYGQHAQWTDFDNASIGGGAGNITVTASNVDDIIRGVQRQIAVAKGTSLQERNGVFFVWRPADFELLTAFMQANGFNTSDNALSGGAQGGVQYMGATHYQSALLTAGHVFAGVKKIAHLGILRDTYGQIVVDEKDPGLVSGISIVSRLDLKVKAWTNTVGLLFDVNVA